MKFGDFLSGFLGVGQVVGHGEGGGIGIGPVIRIGFSGGVATEGAVCFPEADVEVERLFGVVMLVEPIFDAGGGDGRVGVGRGIACGVVGFDVGKARRGVFVEVPDAEEGGVVVGVGE